MTRLFALIAATLALPASPALAGELHQKPFGHEFFDPYSFQAYERGGPVHVPRGAVFVSFSTVDQNHNHVWDGHEIEHVFGVAARDVILSFDANADGRITLLEVRAFDDGAGGPDGILWESP